MNKLKFSKVCTVLLAAFSPHVLAEINLEIDRDLLSGGQPVIPVIPTTGNTSYNVSPDRQVNIKTAHAVICNRIQDYVPVSNVHVRVLDPNNNNKGDGTGLNDFSLMGVKSNVQYSIARKAVVMESEFRSKSICLSSSEFDVIFDDGFADDPVIDNSDVQYVFTNQPQGGYGPGDNVAYQVTYTNNGELPQLLDFIEYIPETNTIDVYFDALISFSCEVLDRDDLLLSTCTSVDGVVRDLVLQKTEKIRLTATRRISPASKVDANLELMAAVFPKTSTIDGAGTNYSFAGFDVNHRAIKMVND